MQILLANAKIMFGKTDRKPLSTPLFQTTADMLAAEMAKMDSNRLFLHIVYKEVDINFAAEQKTVANGK